MPSDIQTTASFTAGDDSDLEGKSIDELDLLRQAFLDSTGVADLNEMTDPEIARYIAIVHRIRITKRVASKPPGPGGSAATKRRRSSLSIDDLLGY
jgi:hypothetical protein